MNNPLKEILAGMREEFASERSQPYRAVLSASRSERTPGSGFGVMADAFKRMGVVPGSESVKTPDSQGLPAGASGSEAPTPEAGVLGSEASPSDPREEYRWILKRIKDLEDKARGQGGSLGEEDQSNLEQLRKSMRSYDDYFGNKKSKDRPGQDEQKKPGRSPGSSEAASQPESVLVPESDVDARLLDFAERSVRRELRLEEYDDYLDLIGDKINALNLRLQRAGDKERAALEEEIDSFETRYLLVAEIQVNMLVDELRSGNISREKVETQFSGIRANLESTGAAMPFHERRAAEIYLRKVGDALGVESAAPVEVELRQDASGSLSTDDQKRERLKQADDAIKRQKMLATTWEGLLAGDGSDSLEFDGKPISLDELNRRISRVKDAFEKSTDKDKLNSQPVRNALVAVPVELQKSVIRVLELASGIDSKMPGPIAAAETQVSNLAERVSNTQTWDELNNVIRQAGSVRSGNVEYSENDVRASITDLRDAVKDANGNLVALIVKTALARITRVGGIRAKAFELLRREYETSDSEMAFEVGDRVLFGGEYWDIAKKFGNTQKVILHRFAIQKSKTRKGIEVEIPGLLLREAKISELTKFIPAPQAATPFEEDFPAESAPASAPERTSAPQTTPESAPAQRPEQAPSIGSPRVQEQVPAQPQRPPVGAPEASRTPETSPSWQAEFGASVYRQYEKKVGGGWWGWIKDRVKGVVTFGVTDYHAAERFRSGTKEIGRHIESASDAMAREATADNERHIRGVVDETMSRLIKKFEGKRASNGQPILTQDKLAALEQQLYAKLRERQAGQSANDKENFAKILRNGLDEKWWSRYVYGAVETALASVGLYFAMPTISSWIFGSGAVAPGTIVPGTTAKGAWVVKAGENPWTISEALLKAGGKAVTPGNVKAVDMVLCQSNGIAAKVWGILGSTLDTAIPVGTSLNTGPAAAVVAAL